MNKHADDTLNETLQAILEQKRPIHFVGIGGIGMSGLAKILTGLNYPVSGSDAKENALIQTLREQGAVIHIGHHAENVPETGALVVSTAIDEQNPEIIRAKALNLPIFHRSALLTEIFQGKIIGHSFPVGLSGTHGKTTMTGMTGLALRAAGLDPTIIAGGKIPVLDTNAILGKTRKIAVAELDESDGSIVRYAPAITVIANLELDHAEHYPQGLAGIQETFLTFLNGLAPGSRVLFNMSCLTVRQLATLAPEKIEKIFVFPEESEFGEGISERACYGVRNVRVNDSGNYQADFFRGRERLGELRLGAPGRHNLTNALFAVAVADLLDADFELSAQAIAGFQGMGRRFERLGRFRGAELVDDYAHHPTEIEVTLKAAREALGIPPYPPPGGNAAIESQRRLTVVFQPHRFTRLQALWEEFLHCFTQADRVIITDVYAASEIPIPGVNAEQFVNALKKESGKTGASDNITLFRGNDWAALRKSLATDIRPGEMIISMGAGDITGLLRGWAETS